MKGAQRSVKNTAKNISLVTLVLLLAVLCGMLALAGAVTLVLFLLMLY